MIKLEKVVKKLVLILAGVMLPTMIMTLLLGTLEVQFSMKEEIRELKMELKNINK